MMRNSIERIDVSDDCKAYLLDVTGVDDRQLEEVTRALPEWRRQRVLAFRHRRGRLESALSYWLLRHALEDAFGYRGEATFGYEEHGKPFLMETRELHFNLSHCRSMVACVVGKCEVGIDVEERGRYTETLARHVMNDEEMNQILSSADPDKAFTQLWTKKEAMVKMTGSGIADCMKTALNQQNAVRMLVKEKHNVICAVVCKK